MKPHLTRCWFRAFGVAACMLALPAMSAGTYSLAYWREVAAYENQAPPAGEFGNHSAFIHVWDENGQPLPGKQIYTSWGVLLGATDANGFMETELRRPNGYDFQVRDGAHLTETTPILSVERAPTWGHYSFETGFMFKQNSTNPGVFDTNYVGTVNASGTDPCRDLSAPCTRSVAYYSTCPTNYCSDQYELGNWANSHAQTFVATGNRVVAVKALMAAGFGVHYYWSAQILEGGPNGTPIGPPRSSRNLVDSEYGCILVKWGINDVQVVPGRTYCCKITKPSGLNVFRVNRNNDPGGNYYENDVAVPNAELMGLIVCANYTNVNAGTLVGSVYDATNSPIGGALVSLNQTGLYTVTESNGNFIMPSILPGTYDVTAAKTGYVARINNGVVISAGLTSTSSFVLALATNITDGIVTNGDSILQPFESTPAWSSTYDAPWGSAASFASSVGGQTGNALQVTRGGPGSSTRVQVFPVRANRPYQISIWMRGPSFSSPYWIECAYKLGNNSAADFDGNSGTWTLIKKFSDTGVNGNSNIWTQYTASINSGGSSQISIGFKHGASPGSGPIVQWDQLSLVSMLLPGVSWGLADSPSNVTVQFADVLNPATATNLANYRLVTGSDSLPILQASLTRERQVVLTTAPQASGSNYTLSVSNVTAPLQPLTLAAQNGQVQVRVPVGLVGLEAASSWKYEQSGTDLGAAWRIPAYNDSLWPMGAPLFADAGNALPDPVHTWLTPATNTPTYYFRKHFWLPAIMTNAQLRLRCLVDDGAVFWLNMGELWRIGITNNPVQYNTRATRTVTSVSWEGPVVVNAPTLVPGTTNCLAVEVHQSDAGIPDVAFGAVLEALVLPSQMPAESAQLSITPEGSGIRLNWSEPGMQLQAATNLTGPWQTWPSASNGVSVLLTNHQQFFRLRQ